MEILNAIIENPIVATVLAAIGPGLFMLYKAVIAAAIRRVNAAYAEPGLCDLPQDAQDRHVTNRVTRETMLPRGVVAGVVRKRASERPPNE